MLHQKDDAVKLLETNQNSQMLQTVSAETNYFKLVFFQTISSRDRVRKQRLWKHFGHFHMVFETAARMRKISLWAHRFEFQFGIQGVFDERARKQL